VSVATLLLGLVTGCGDDAGTAETDDACAPYAAYSGHSGTTVRLYTQIRDVEGEKYQRSWEDFQTCTDISISYEGDNAFEANLPARIAEGNPPDVVFLSQPGLLTDIVRTGAAKVVGKAAQANLDKGWSDDWKRYGTVDGQLYAVPLEAQIKSLVWYSPTLFREKGYQVPTTWEQLIALSDRMVADGMKPWCAGIESGKATGWPLTDWIEDVLLRTAGPDVYDQWVTHQIPFNDPRIAEAVDRVGQILKNPAYVNGGHGEVASIATTAFQEGGLPILERKCGLHRQASFYFNQWPSGTDVSAEGDVFAFYLPTIGSGTGKPVLGAASFVTAFNSRPEVQAFTAYLASPEWATSRARLGGWVTANKGADTSVLTALEKLSFDLLTDPEATFRFDGSDLMPAAVGAGTFWSGVTDWINGRSTAEVLARIEAGWPAR
jgi:alpha-glucoside transport system substrate-binding protein